MCGLYLANNVGTLPVAPAYPKDEYLEPTCLYPSPSGSLAHLGDASTQMQHESSSIEKVK
jgi:hypothetical protein